MRIIRFLIIIAVITFTSYSLAEQDYKHAKGLPAETLAEAIKNYDQYNTKLADLLEQQLTPETMHEIHMLSYTLENALERIDVELTQHRDDLERIHKASEHMNADELIAYGNKYFATSSTLRK